MKNSLLWQITSPQGIKSFLFGTMHVRDFDAFSDLELVKACIDQSDRYYSEIEVDNAGMAVLSQFHQLPDGQLITDLITGNQYRRLRSSVLKSFGMDIDHFRRFYPLIISNLIQTSILSKSTEVIMDYYLYQYAAQQNKEMCFLESYMEQISLFHRIPLDYQVKSLIMLGKQPSKAKNQIRTLLRDYARKDTRLLYQKSKKQLGKLRHILLYQRNISMADLLIKDLDTVSGFVGVGAAHLYGYKGILRLMKKAGYQLKPVTPNIHHMG